jgi:hypothetical protein
MRIVIRGAVVIGLATIVCAAPGSADAGSKSTWGSPKGSARRDAASVPSHHAHHAVDTNLATDSAPSHHKNKSTTAEPEQKHADRDWEHKHPPAVMP